MFIVNLGWGVAVGAEDVVDDVDALHLDEVAVEDVEVPSSAGLDVDVADGGVSAADNLDEWAHLLLLGEDPLGV